MPIVAVNAANVDLDDPAPEFAVLRGILRGVLATRVCPQGQELGLQMAGQVAEQEHLRGPGICASALEDPGEKLVQLRVWALRLRAHGCAQSVRRKGVRVPP